jgi:hypothetical protein
MLCEEVTHGQQHESTHKRTIGTETQPGGTALPASEPAVASSLAIPPVSMRPKSFQSESERALERSQ